MAGSSATGRPCPGRALTDERNLPCLPVSISGFPISITVYHSLKDPRRRWDLWLGRLQDRRPARPGPCGKRRAKVAVVEVFGRDHLALPVGEPVGEGPVPGGQITDPLADLLGRLVRVHRELVALGMGDGLGFTGAQRRLRSSSTWREGSSGPRGGMKTMIASRP